MTKYEYGEWKINNDTECPEAPDVLVQPQYLHENHAAALERRPVRARNQHRWGHVICYRTARKVETVERHVVVPVSNGCGFETKNIRIYYRTAGGQIDADSLRAELVP